MISGAAALAPAFADDGFHMAFAYSTISFMSAPFSRLRSSLLDHIPVVVLRELGKVSLYSLSLSFFLAQLPFSSALGPFLKARKENILRG